MTGPSAELRGEVLPTPCQQKTRRVWQRDAVPQGAVEARSLHSFELTLTCGCYGLDDTGSIRIVFRVTTEDGLRAWTSPVYLINDNWLSVSTSQGEFGNRRST